MNIEKIIKDFKKFKNLKEVYYEKGEEIGCGEMIYFEEIEVEIGIDILKCGWSRSSKSDKTYSFTINSYNNSIEWQVKEWLKFLKEKK